MPIKKYNEEQHVTVGIVSGERISFSLNGQYTVNGKTTSGEQLATVGHGFVMWNGKPYTEIRFEPTTADCSFSLKDVTIGVNFHWERKETQTFLGSMRLLADNGKIWAINELPVETYLESVISSEMSATSNLFLLMAHAVISRSWLLRNMRHGISNSTPITSFSDISRLIKWYDHTDHTLFDVCADDHCQRYQGITMETSPNAKVAVQKTRGQVLAYDGEICDARFSKCCGGAMEEFQYCWEDSPKPYLKGIGDSPSEKIPDLAIEENARKWILSEPESFCNTKDKRILSQVLNNYDQETTDFYRWQVEYTQSELSALVKRKTGIDFGDVTDLIPMKRGTSGRIYELKIVGTKRTMTIGKELEIRRALSETHLYSSAFVVEKRTIDQISPIFHLTGAGWGHGVGLCQIGAAVMGDKGYSYEEILKHYYPGATIESAW